MPTQPNQHPTKPTSCKRRAPKPRLPRGPDDQARTWQPPGVRKDAPPRPVAKAVRRDRRQIRLDLADGT
jgi:hypothetical protein